MKGKMILKNQDNNDHISLFGFFTVPLVFLLIAYAAVFIAALLFVI